MKIIYNISQCVTMAGGPRRGERLADPAILDNAAIVIFGDKILEVGNSEELLSRYPLA